MDIKELAMDYYKRRFNCAQAVLAACGMYTGLDEKTALAIAAGFGGGMRSGETCGSVSGAIMALGATFPSYDGQNKEAKDKIARLAKECVSACKDKYGCVRCAELKKNGVSCPELIGTMAETAERLILENKKYKLLAKWRRHEYLRRISRKRAHSSGN